MRAESIELRSTLGPQELYDRLVLVLRERLREFGEDPGRPSALRIVLVVEPAALVLRPYMLYRRYAGAMDLVVRVDAAAGGGSYARARREPQLKRFRLFPAVAVIALCWLCWAIVQAGRSTESPLLGVLVTLAFACLAVFVLAFLPVVADRKVIDAQMVRTEEVLAAVFRDSRQALGAAT